MKKTITTILILITFLAPNICFSQDLDENIPAINTPQDLVSWLSKEFNYQWEIVDDWKTPQETINSKKGDCEDFAILASVALSGMGISNDILVIKFKDLNLTHCICVWKDKDGTYKFISNRSLQNTGKYEIKAAIEKFYPDWEKITFTDQDKKYAKVIRRL
tara:strand:- start:1382 stop:1864 length:483 start_codon:yes stop_codon:yes gene_type:complete